MKPLHDCTVVGLDYLTTAPTSITVAVTARATPAQVFAALEDAAAWPKWAPAIKKVTWTSPKPFGLGTTRTVDLVAGMVAEEEFIGWEPNRRMAFYFTRTSMPADAFAEDYVLSDMGDGRTKIAWTMAMTPEKGRKNPKVVDALMAKGNAWMLGRFAKLVERGGR